MPPGTGPVDFAATGIYLLRRGSTVPTQIAVVGGTTPLGGTYYQTYGPLALSGVTLPGMIVGGEKE